MKVLGANGDVPELGGLEEPSLIDLVDNMILVHVHFIYIIGDISRGCTAGLLAPSSNLDMRHFKEIQQINIGISMPTTNWNCTGTLNESRKGLCIAALRNNRLT